nr:hypothetical protein Iba_chr05cCG3790 [Ipomoea batatas]
MLLLGRHWRVLRLKGAPTTMPDSFAMEVAVTIASCTFQGFWGALLATRHEFSTAVCYMAACAGSMVLQAFSVCCLVRMDLDLGLKDLHAYDDALIGNPSDLGLILEGGCGLKAIDLGIPSNFSLLLDSIEC